MKNKICFATQVVAIFTKLFFLLHFSLAIPLIAITLLWLFKKVYLCGAKSCLGFVLKKQFH
jgi:hypothetical protein